MNHRYLILSILLMVFVATTEQRKAVQDAGMAREEKTLLDLLFGSSESTRQRRSPQLTQSFLVQGLSRPFCTLFGTNRCFPYTPFPTAAPITQCNLGYRWDWVTRQCRLIQNRK